MPSLFPIAPSPYQPPTQTFKNMVHQYITKLNLLQTITQPFLQADFDIADTTKVWK